MSESAAIKYIPGDVTRPVKDGKEAFIVHCCNDIGGWGAGVVLAISARWPEPEAAYRRWAVLSDTQETHPPFQLGSIQVVPVEEGVNVVNLIGQHKTWPKDGVPPIRYEAIREGLRTLVDTHGNGDMTIHAPRLGAALAGGSWAVIEAILIEECVNRGVDVIVYDFPGSTFNP